MLQQPMIEKLLAMRLHGMAEALKAQEQDEAVQELSFPDRLGMLIDRQWTWRQNQALARRLKGAKLRGDSAVEDIDYRAARGLDNGVIRALTQETARGAEPRESVRARPHGRGKELRGVGTGAEGLPRRILGLVHARHLLVSRIGAGTRRWKPANVKAGRRPTLQPSPQIPQYKAPTSWEVVYFPSALDRNMMPDLNVLKFCMNRQIALTLQRTKPETSQHDEPTSRPGGLWRPNGALLSVG